MDYSAFKKSFTLYQTLLGAFMESWKGGQARAHTLLRSVR